MENSQVDTMMHSQRRTGTFIYNSTGDATDYVCGCRELDTEICLDVRAEMVAWANNFGRQGVRIAKRNLMMGAQAPVQTIATK